MDRSKPRDCQWEVDGLRFAGLSWGEPGEIPVLALHGWMDHAGSFATLAPLMTGFHVVAIDLSGQGQSAHRAAHATYNIWDDLPQITRILDALGWDRCIFMGHSRGANIATLFAAAQPERVAALILLDSLISEPSGKTIVETLRSFVEDTRKQTARPPRIFASVEEYVARRVGQGNSRATAMALAERALEQVEGGYRLRGDARMFASSAVKLTQAHVETILAAIRCPVLNIWAKDGIKRRGTGSADLATKAATIMAHYQSLDLAGDHHFHMDPAAAQQIADAIQTLVEQHRPV